MSLDVYLTLPGDPEPIPSSGRIFVRRDGATVEVSRAEWDEMYPDREPVWQIGEMNGREVYEANITHNMSRMARECGLYEPLWRPGEIGATHARDLIFRLREGLGELRSDRERLQAFNPENGWGDYDLLVRFTEDYLAACERHPEAEVSVSV